MALETQSFCTTPSLFPAQSQFLSSNIQYHRIICYPHCNFHQCFMQCPLYLLYSVAHINQKLPTKVAERFERCNGGKVHTFTRRSQDSTCKFPIFVFFPQQLEKLGVLPKLRGGLGQPPETLDQVPWGSAYRFHSSKFRFHKVPLLTVQVPQGST